MNRHLIVGRFGLSDNIQLEKDNDEVINYLDFIIENGKLTPWLETTLRRLNDLKLQPSNLGFDLLIIASHVNLADTHISRMKDSQDSWTREIRLVIPVSDPIKWRRSATTIEKMLNFLTGDIWVINFRKRPQEIQAILTIKNKPENPKFDRLSLFSGGLDSLIGAIDLLEQGNNPLFISYLGDGSVSSPQNKLFSLLKKEYPKRNFERFKIGIEFPKEVIKESAHENTSRGRSFHFIAIAILAGTAFSDRFLLNIPENGLIALNVPLDNLRLGSLSTRTTHPYYLSLWNTLLSELQIDGRLENPYWKKTKGNMIKGCSNINFLKKSYVKSMSCAAPTKLRWFGFTTQHCGYCLPCIIRKASLNFGLGKGIDKTKYWKKDLKRLVSENNITTVQQIRSFQYALNVISKNPKISKYLIHLPGPLPAFKEEDLKSLEDVYWSGLKEIAILL
ncbi:Qat anti-phage system QueC-like protein QatC [Leptospira sp. WS58.C1]|uniref:Qat anti-phage system QueC-like protein QatC n=1 Tax=Leptospira cinconiae TaxID=3235173 RepID=UPI00349E6C01